MKRIALIFIFCLLCNTAGAEIVDEVIAVVNGHVITQSDLTRATAPYFDNKLGSAPNGMEAPKVSKEEALDMLVNNILLDDAMKKADVKVNVDEIDKAIETILSRNHITLDILQTELARRGVPFQDYKKEVEDQLKRQNFINKEVGSKVIITDHDMQQYYVEHMSQFSGGPTAHIAQITLPFTQGMTKEGFQALVIQAKNIAGEVNKGNFAALAKKYSKGPFAENGGDMGVVDLKSLNPEIAKVIDQTRVGEISEPVISPAGIHIIFIKERGAATHKDFPRYRDMIYGQMYEQRFQDALNSYFLQLRQNAYISVKKELVSRTK